MGNVLLLGRSTNIAPLLITTLSPLTGTSANAVYSQQMTAIGGVAPYTWSRSNFRANGGPLVTPWFGINQNTGLISGTAPNDAELDTFTVTVTDFLGHSVSTNFSLQVSSSGSLIITTNLLAGTLTGIGYASAPLAASGGTAPYTWNLVSAAPNYDMWLRCDGAKLYGIAQMVETESVTIRVRDSAGETTTTTLALAVTASGALAIATPAGMTVAQYYTASPILGTAYALRMLAQGGQPPYRWAFSGPAFAVVGASGTNYQLPFDGWLQGATNGTSADSLTAVCTDNNGATITQTVTLTNVAAAGHLTFMPLDTTDGGLPLINMPSAYVGTPFTYQLQVAGGSGSGRVFSVSSGALPAGLALFPGGLISGSPTQTGASNSCIVKCVDSTNATATAHLYFNIDAANKGVRPGYNSGAGLYVDAGGILRDPQNYLFQFRGMDRTHFDSAGWAGPANGALARPGAVRTNYFNLGLTPAQIASNFVAQHINNNQVPILMYGYYPGGVQVTGTSDIARFASNCLTDWVNAFGAFQPYLNTIIVNIANEWGPGSSTAWQNAYQAVFANVSAISGTTITVNTVSGSNPFANCPLAYLNGAGSIANQVITLSSPAGSSGAWTVQSSVSFSGYTGGGTLNGGAVGILRAVGYTCPLMIDTGSSGEDLWNIVNYSVAINNSDPRKCCIFSLHPYQSANPWQAIVHSVTIGNPTVLTLLSNWADFPLNPGASVAGNDNFNDHYQITGALGLTSLNGIQPSDVHTFGSAANWQVHLTVDSSGWTGTYTADSATLVPASTNSRQAHFNYVFAQLAALRASGVCAVMGEFGPGNQSGNVLTSEGSLNNQQATPGELICAAEANAIPWMGWAWDDHNPNTTAFSGNWFNMTFGNNGVYSKPTDLTAFGVDAVTNPRYGLWAMAQPAPSLLSGGVTLTQFTVQNTGASSLPATYQTIGQVFKRSAVFPNTKLVGMQMDAQAVYSDGSVKMAAITAQLPALAAGASSSAQPLITANTGAPALTSAFFLASITGLTTTLNVTAPVVNTQTIDLKGAFTTAFAGTPDIWLQGPLALQARVDVPVTITGLAQAQALHITADVTVYADGSVRADIQFCNDLTTLQGTTNTPILAPLVYTATITLNGATTSYPNGGTITAITQYQYQKWRAVLTSNGVAPWGVWTTPYNVQSDITYLRSTAAIPPYDLTNPPVPLLAGYSATIASTNFGQPFTWNGTFQNGVTNNLGVVGDNPHLGPVSEWGAAWLQTQDHRAAQISLAIGDTAGSIPIHVKVGNAWATVLTTPKIWLDVGSTSRIGGGELTFANGSPFSSGAPSSLSGWVGTLLTQHYPCISTVPYLLTANRWFLDNLNAFAAYSLCAVRYTGRLFNKARQATSTLPLPAGYYSDILMFAGQGSVAPRAVGWSLRDVADAAYIGKTGSVDQVNCDQIIQDNMSWAVAQIPGGSNPWLDNCGEATGFWMPQLQASGIYSGAYQDPAAPPAPVLSSVTNSGSGGTLAAAKYYYQVTAVGSGGESIGSNELSVGPVVGSTNSNTVSWAAVAGVTGYNIFRGTGGAAENVMYSVAAGVTSFLDTGTAGAARVPVPVGASNSALGESLWQFDFETSTLLKCAAMGYADAVTLAQFQRNWLSGRWINLGHDSCTYRLMLAKGPGVATYNLIQVYGAKPPYQQTWAAIETLQQECFDPTPPYGSGLANGSGWANSTGYYGNVYRMTLGWLATVYGGQALAPADVMTAFNGITSSGAPNVGTNPLDNGNWLHGGCKWNIVPTSGVG